MGDDPYNFEIALPASSIAAPRSNGKNSSSFDSDEERSDASGSLSDASGISSDNDRDRDKPKFVAPSKVLTTNRRMEATTASASSGSALDKAKSFLSKYSSVKATSSYDSKKAMGSRTRRINLDSDEEDISLDSSSSGESESTNSKQATHAALSEINTRGELVTHPTQKSEQHEAVYARPSAVNDLNSDEAESQNNDRALPHNENGAASLTIFRAKEQSIDGSQAEDSIESFHSQSDHYETIKPPPVQSSTTLPIAVHHDRHEDSDAEYNESFHEESMASHSNMKTSQDTSLRDAKNNIAKLQQSVASESGVYDEDAFEEEESTRPVQQPTTKAGPVITLSPSANQTAQKTGGTFDYSMDFSEDESEGQSPLQASTPPKDKPVRLDSTLQNSNSPPASRQSDDDSDGEEQSALLESESNHEDTRDISAIDPTTTIFKEVEIHSVAKSESSNGSLTSQGGHPTRNLVSEDNLPHTNAQFASIEVGTSLPNKTKGLDSTLTIQVPSIAQAQDPFPTATATPIQTSSREANQFCGNKHVMQNRPRVAIIRACTSEENYPVEMKDASTQFTGNHAAIQTDLVPDGMHSLLVNSLSMSTPLAPQNEGCYGKEDNASPTEDESVHQRSKQPPPPPISPVFGSSMYSMDALRLPATVSSSIYKQQLLALQDQILQKKRETERIVHDRMTYQYSSLRGTERFIAARRKQKMELWEALMQVDPTLSEQKAREVARLAQAAST